MTQSASTPRLRATLAGYVALLAATALATPRPLAAATAAVVDALALACVVLAVLGRIWCSVFIAGRKDAELVVDGPYALCRHPLYSLSFVAGAGLGIATHSILLAGMTMLGLTLLLRRAARSEDAFLAHRHGEAFRGYAASTPRFLPRTLRHAMPRTREVIPAVLWKAFVDAATFLLLYMLVVTLRRLGEAGVLPSLGQLP